MWRGSVFYNDSKFPKQLPVCVSCKKSIFKRFAKFTGKHLCQSLIFNKVSGLRPATLLKKWLAQVLSYESCGFFWETLLYRKLPGDCFLKVEMITASYLCMFMKLYSNQSRFTCSKYQISKFKVQNTRITCGICSKLAIATPMVFWWFKGNKS